MPTIGPILDKKDCVTLLIMLLPLGVCLGLLWLDSRERALALTALGAAVVIGVTVRWLGACYESWRIAQARRRLIASWRSCEGIGNGG